MDDIPMKSRFLKTEEVFPEWRYLVHVTLDHAPDRGEVGDIENKIKDSFAKLGVSSDRVGIVIFKSAPEYMPPPEYESNSPAGEKRYIGFLCLWSEDGGFTEDPTEVGERARRAYIKYSGCTANGVEIVVLDNCFVEIMVNKPIV